MSFEHESLFALNELLTEFGSYWVWNDRTLLGMQSDKTDSNSVELTGLLPDSSFTVCFRKSDFNLENLPESGEIITDCRGDDYRIESVETSISDPSLTLSCSSIDGK